MRRIRSKHFPARVQRFRRLIPRPCLPDRPASTDDRPDRADGSGRASASARVRDQRRLQNLADKAIARPLPAREEHLDFCESGGRDERRRRYEQRDRPTYEASTYFGISRNYAKRLDESPVRGHGRGLDRIHRRAPAGQGPHRTLRWLGDKAPLGVGWSHVCSEFAH